MEFKRLMFFVALVAAMFVHVVSRCNQRQVGCGGEADSPPLVVECGGGCAQFIPPPPPVVECGGGCVTIPQSPPPPSDHGGFGLGYIIGVIVEVVVGLRIIYFFVEVYDHCFGKGHERRLRKIRKRNARIEKVLKKAREQAEEISKLEETISRMEEGKEQMERGASCSCSSEETSSMESEDVEDDEDVDAGDY